MWRQSKRHDEKGFFSRALEELKAVASRFAVPFKGIVRFGRYGNWRGGREEKIKVLIRDARAHTVLEWEHAILYEATSGQ